MFRTWLRVMDGLESMPNPSLDRLAAAAETAIVLTTQSAVVSMDGSQQFAPGKPTGLQVQAGDQVRFVCTGFIDEGDHNLGSIEADGDGRAPDHHLIDDGPADDKYPLPSTTRYALAAGILAANNMPIARFAVGRVKTLAAPQTGSLVLFANDDKPSDNKPIPNNKLQTPWVVSVDVTHDDGIQPPPNTPGLEIADIEVVQVSQNGMGDSVMVGGKTTAVRVFLTVPDLSRVPPGAQVNGFVKVFSVPPGAGPGLMVGQFQALNPTGAANQVQIAVKGQLSDRNQTKASLNFEVPGSVLAVNVDISHYRFEVTASVGSVAGAGGAGFVASGQRTAGFVRPGRPIGLSLVRVTTPVNGSPAQMPVLANLDWASLGEQLPVPDAWSANPLQMGSPIQDANPPSIILDIDVGGDGSKYADVLGRLGALQLMNQLNVASPGDVILGLVPANPNPPGTITDGIQSGNRVVVGAYPKASTIAAHEINHTLGIMHAASPSCATPANIDASLPIASDAPGWSSAGAAGINAHSVVATPTPALMGYCAAKWPTAKEYDRGYRRLTGS